MLSKHMASTPESAHVYKNRTTVQDACLHVRRRVWRSVGLTACHFTCRTGSRVTGIFAIAKLLYSRRLLVYCNDCDCNHCAVISVSYLKDLSTREHR